MYPKRKKEEKKALGWNEYLVLVGVVGNFLLQSYWFYHQECKGKDRK